MRIFISRIFELSWSWKNHFMIVARYLTLRHHILEPKGNVSQEFLRSYHYNLFGKMTHDEAFRF